METEERLAQLEARVAVLESALTSLASVGQGVRSSVALRYDGVSLSALDLRPRSVCVLMHNNILSVGQLLRMRESDLLRLVGVGRAIVREVQDCLRAQSLRLLSE
jgi:DNA-directed RNA polymerase alpha subunit